MAQKTSGFMISSEYFNKIVVDMRTGSVGRVIREERAPDIVLYVRFADGSENKLNLARTLFANLRQIGKFEGEEKPIE